jgi:hypothetical protein
MIAWLRFAKKPVPASHRPILDDDPSRSYSVGFIMRPKQNKFDGVILRFATIGTSDNNVIAFFSAHAAIQVYDDKIALHRTGIKTLPIALQRFA